MAELACLHMHRVVEGGQADGGRHQHGAPGEPGLVSVKYLGLQVTWAPRQTALVKGQTCLCT